MQKGFPKSLFENILVLALLGILAGAVAGFGIGMVQKKSSTPASAAR